MRVFLLCAAISTCCCALCDGEVIVEGSSSGSVSERCGLGLVYGNTFSPNDEIQFAHILGFAQFRHDVIWPYFAPEALRFKTECCAGVTTIPKTRFMASAGLVLLYYIGDFGRSRFRPYIESGCHIIYSDFQVPGQGLRFNFNPQGGVGAEFQVTEKHWFYLSFRIQHISNASLYPENAGIDSVAITVGRLF